jgi:DNA excision repair protein ERCC-4
MPSLIHIRADDREQRSALVAELRGRLEFELTVERLRLGDYCVDGRFLVERKTLTDLAASIKSGRLFTQALRLAEVDDLRSALLLEGQSRDLRHCGMRWEAFQGALVTVSVFIGLPILRARSAQESANTLLSIARQGRSVAAGALPRRGRRPKNKRALQLHLLQGLPGVGPKRAADLLQYFTNVANVFDADPCELAKVAGIGHQTARRINWAVEESPSRYGLD